MVVIVVSILRRSFVRVDTYLSRIQLENGRNQKANFVCNNAEGLRKTLQGSFELSL